MDYLVDVKEQGVSGLELEVLADELDDPTDLLLTVHLKMEETHSMMITKDCLTL